MKTPIESEPRRPLAEDTALLRAVAERIEPDDPELASWCRRYARQHQARLAADLALVTRFASAGARVLEYGAIPLLMTTALEERGFEVSALDLAPERFASAIGKLELDVRRCDVETDSVPFEDQEFDLILFNELFEHLRIDPIFTLAEARRVLAPGGRLLLSTPNLRSLRGLKNLLLYNQGHASSAGVYRQYEKLRTLGHMGHVREYTTFEVSEFLERSGFEIERIVFRGGHGSGVVGLAERFMPKLRPFFSIVARKAAGSAS